MHYIPTEPELAHVGGNTIGGNPDTFMPELWKWLVERCSIKTVLDVGCGEGHAMREFEHLGCSTHGIDGAHRNARLAHAVTWDLTRAPYIYCYVHEDSTPIDIVYSCEVVGYIEEKYLDNVLKTLTQGRWLAFTHQLPGQGGPTRNDGKPYLVNGQTPEYWRNHLSRYGFVRRDDLTNESKQYGKVYWTLTGAIYERAS